MVEVRCPSFLLQRFPDDGGPPHQAGGGSSQLHDWSSDQLCVKIPDMKRKARTINASEFKARCLKILDELEPSGILILKRGKPVARLIPVPDRNPFQLVGSLKGKIKIKGDIFSTQSKWNAES